jgi:hypothetical protein
MLQSCQYLQLKHSTNFEKADIVTVAVSKNGKVAYTKRLHSDDRSVAAN